MHSSQLYPNHVAIVSLQQFTQTLSTILENINNCKAYIFSSLLDIPIIETFIHDEVVAVQLILFHLLMCFESELC